MCVYESESVIHSVMFNSIIPWTVACQAALSMEFFSKNIGVGIPVSTPGDLPNPGIKPRSPTLQVDSLLFGILCYSSLKGRNTSLAFAPRKSNLKIIRVG